MAQKNGVDLDLSLTGSQISGISASGKRPRSAQHSRQPSPGIEPRKNKTSTLRERSGSIGELSSARINRKQTPASSTPLSSHRSQISDISSVSKNALSSRSRTKSNDDFLSLFENSTKPKIKKPSSSNNEKKKTQSKLPWENTPSKKKVATMLDSARSVTAPHTNRSDLSEPHNIFQPNLDRGSSDDDDDDDVDNIEESLSRSINKLQTLQNQLSRVNKNNSSEDIGTSNLSPRQPVNVSSSIANNMTSPRNKALQPKIEKSYQNIKKAPVNQERISGKQVGLNVAEDYIQSLNMAATKIQKWYRRHDTRKKASEAAVRRLLSQKHHDKMEERKQDVHLSLTEKEIEERKKEERIKIREEKARQTRQQAIQDLHRKREERKEDVKKKAEEEISYLQANGKLKKTPSKTSLNGKKKTSPRNPIYPDQPSSGRTEKTEETLTNGDISSVVDEIFQSGPFSPRSRTGGKEGEDNITPRNKKSPSHVSTHSTLNDLFDTLRKLEADEHLETPRPEKKRNTWLDELTSEDGKEYNLTAENLSRLGRKDGLDKSGFLTDSKLKSIISFLDEVQVSDRISVIDSELNKINDGLVKPAILVPDPEEIVQYEQAQATASEVTNTVLSQRLELDEKRRTVTMLQKALNQQRELTVRHAKETEKEMSKRLDVQKEEYEEAIKRHLSFIDQLIDDKKNLSEKCESLVKELKTVDKKYQDKIKSLDDTHNMEISKMKDIHSASEKLRREKWIEDKTKKIKEMTVKGLEPEIQRLIAKHKSEMKKVKQIHDAELLQADERAAQRYVTMTEELRDQLAREKEEACRRERELAKERYEKQLQQEELAYQQQRRRLYSEVQEEKDRVSTQGSRQRSELETLRRQLEDNHRLALDAMKTEFEKSREETEKRHTTEIHELQERLKVEKEAWEENYIKKQETWLMSKERELKENVRKDRDKEIELVISRLEEDATSSREECERAAENRIKRFREKYDNEMKELEKSERQAIQRYNEIKAQMAEVEGENERLKVVIKQKDREIADTKKLIEKLQEERGKVSDIIRQEFADRIVTTEEENKRIKNDISELRAKHRIEIEKTKNLSEEIRKQKDDELEEVHKRVKQAILKKEDVVSQLRQQYQAALKRADHLEGLLEQQRKQLLAGKKIP